MAKFRFQFEALLDVRKRTEEQRQLVVAELERERLAIEEELRQCQRSIVQTKGGLRDALGGPQAARGESAMLDLSVVRMQTSAGFQLTHRAQQIAIRLAGAHRRLEAARASLLEATIARKAVELLKDKRFAEWKRELDRRELAAVDELTTMRAGRRGEASR